MESSRKKALELMQRGIVTYKLITFGWQVSNHLGDGYDLVLLKDERQAKVELKAIDLAAIKVGNNATQHLSANEVVSATHLIITVFNKIGLKANFIMTIQQFVEHIGSKKFTKYQGYEQFLNDYRKQATAKAIQRKGLSTLPRLNMDFNFDPDKIEDWKLACFKNRWENLDSLK